MTPSATPSERKRERERSSNSPYFRPRTYYLLAEKDPRGQRQRDTTRSRIFRIATSVERKLARRGGNNFVACLLTLCVRCVLMELFEKLSPRFGYHRYPFTFIRNKILLLVTKHEAPLVCSFISCVFFHSLSSAFCTSLALSCYSLPLVLSCALASFVRFVPTFCVRQQGGGGEEKYTFPCMGNDGNVAREDFNVLIYVRRFVQIQR